MTAQARPEAGLSALVGDRLPVPCVDGQDRPYLNLDAAASTSAFPCVASWSRGDTDLIRATSERVLACARTVLDHLGLPIPAAPAA